MPLSFLFLNAKSATDKNYKNACQIKDIVLYIQRQ